MIFLITPPLTIRAR